MFGMEEIIQLLLHMAYQDVVKLILKMLLIALMLMHLNIQSVKINKITQKKKKFIFKLI